MKYLLLLLLPLLLFATNSELNNIIKQKELNYYYLDKSGIKSLSFENNFLKIVFNDKKTICENDEYIVDNCSFMVKKNLIINNSYATLYLKDLFNLSYMDKLLIRKGKDIKHIFYLINPLSKNYKKIETKKNKILEQVNIVYVITNKDSLEEINKVLDIKLNKNEFLELQKIYNKYSKIKLPITLVLN